MYHAVSSNKKLYCDSCIVVAEQRGEVKGHVVGGGRGGGGGGGGGDGGCVIQ